MVRYVTVGIASGVMLGVLDAVINANPLARRLYDVYRPIARASVDLMAGVAIDLVYGLALAGAFVLLSPSLPGKTGLAKGLSFALLIWFLRVFMSAASQWMMFELPASTLAYSLAAGMGEMVALGTLYGLTLKPRNLI